MYIEALLVAFIPTFTVIINRYLSFRISVYNFSSVLAIVVQFILSVLILGVITLFEGEKAEHLFFVATIINALIFLLRLFAFSLPPMFSRIFNLFLPVTNIGIETVFLASIPFVEAFDTVKPFYGILIVVLLKFVINYFVMLPVLNALTNVYMVAFLIFISQLIPMVLFARLPFNLVDLDYVEATKKSLKEFTKYFKISLTIGAIYSLIIAFVSVGTVFTSDQYVLPAVLNFVSILMFVYFFTWSYAYEK
jgi:hypothetical protein